MSDLDDLGLDDLTSRPLVPGDAQGVFEVMAADELLGTGEVHIELADIVADWQRPSFDLATQSIGVLDGERVVGYAEVVHGRRAHAAVHPDRHGRGIGTALARWTQRISVRDGSGLVGMPVPEGSPGDRLLTALGYQPLWTSWVLELPEGAEIVPQPVPEQYAIRAAADDADLRDAHEVIDAAFLEWAERDPEPYEDFLAETVHRPGYAGWQVRVLRDDAAGGAACGAAVVQLADEVAYVDRLAVRQDRRGQGLARALLVDAFATAREHGATRCELSTDSRTGALGLYEKVGMQVTSVWKHLAIQS